MLNTSIQMSLGLFHFLHNPLELELNLSTRSNEWIPYLYYKMSNLFLVVLSLIDKSNNFSKIIIPLAFPIYLHIHINIFISITLNPNINVNNFFLFAFHAATTMRNSFQNNRLKGVLRCQWFSMKVNPVVQN